jgi:choline dehydrogenase-like flavoprotein
MIQDLRSVGNGQALSVDICIVGAGAAGITIAKELMGSGLTVCLVEAGGMNEEDTTQAIYRGESIGHQVILDEGRYRVFGGSATRWGGRCAMFDPIDFEHRNWINKSGWPIDLTTMLPYYSRAQKIAGFKDPWKSDSTEISEALGIALPQFTTKAVQPFVWRYAAEGYRYHFSWARAYAEELKNDNNTHVILHANLTAFEGSDDGSNIETITVSSLDNTSMTVKARAFVLSCGGIENVRLLLNAPETIQQKLNASDYLGRCFAQHPRGCIATLSTSPKIAKRLQRLFTTFYRRTGVPYEIGFALSEDAQREHHLVNASAAIYYHARPESTWKSLARLWASFRAKKRYDGMLKDAVRALSGFPSVVANLGRRIIFGHPAIIANPFIEILVDLEQVPDPQSRVMLSDQTDPFGMRRARVDWKLSEIERKTARIFNGYIADELKQLGFGQTIPAAWLTSDAPLREDELWGTYHHIGTTRMSQDSSEGVVNEDCRAHGVYNLYFAGCSVFPTGGHANPTLTIVALSIRLADHLRSRFKN